MLQAALGVKVNAWPHIQGQQQWIDENYDLRIQIAHGTASVNVEAIESAAVKGAIIRKVARQFLFDLVLLKTFWKCRLTRACSRLM